MCYVTHTASRIGEGQTKIKVDGELCAVNMDLDHWCGEKGQRILDETVDPVRVRRELNKLLFSTLNA